MHVHTPRCPAVQAQGCLLQIYVIRSRGPASERRAQGLEQIHSHGLCHRCPASKSYKDAILYPTPRTKQHPSLEDRWSLSSLSLIPKTSGFSLCLYLLSCHYCTSNFLSNVMATSRHFEVDSLPSYPEVVTKRASVSSCAGK